MAEKTESELDIIKDLNDYRRRIASGQPVTDEELQAAIQKLQTFRDKTAKPIKEAAVKKATTTAKKTNKAAAMDLLGDLLAPRKP